jgi:hypothetical protein
MQLHREQKHNTGAEISDTESVTSASINGHPEGEMGLDYGDSDNEDDSVFQTAFASLSAAASKSALDLITPLVKD